jgi:N-glycosylase/DNA lyase
MGDYYSFPTREQLLSLTEEDFSKIGAGYRAKYLYNVLRQVDEKMLKEWDALDTASLRNKLISLSGVGPKVADCILLFGYYRQDVFPVDTWIEQMYNEYIDDKLHDRNKIRNDLVKMFGNLSGYAQQYLFYYQRSGIDKE